MSALNFTQLPVLLMNFVCMYLVSANQFEYMDHISPARSTCHVYMLKSVDPEILIPANVAF